MKVSEADLARVLVEYLQRDEWEVYQEVQMYSHGQRCDIYAVRGAVSWAIETKTACSLKVIEQAAGWRHRANYVSIAVPNHGRFAKEVCYLFGIGILEIRQGAPYDPVLAILDPELRRKIHRPQLHEQQKTYAEAGNSKCRYFTPFQQTKDLLRHYVQRNPGAALRDAMTAIDHHYASDKSAVQSMSQWLWEGKVEGVEIRRDGKHVRVYPQEE